MGIECKLTESPKATKSMHTALDILELDTLKVVHMGKKSYSLANQIEAVPIQSLVGVWEPADF